MHRLGLRGDVFVSCRKEDSRAQILLELMAFSELNYAHTKRTCFYRERFTVSTWKEMSEWEEFSGVDTTFLQLYISRN